MLDDAGVPFAVHRREAVAGTEDLRDVAAALGTDPRQMVRTELSLVDGQPIFALVPATAEVDLPAIAAAVGSTEAVACDADQADKLLGKHGDQLTALSPDRTVPVIMDAGCLDSRTVFLAAGEPGAFVELSPSDLIACVGGRTAPIAAPNH